MFDWRKRKALAFRIIALSYIGIVLSAADLAYVTVPDLVRLAMSGVPTQGINPYSLALLLLVQCGFEFGAIYTFALRLAKAHKVFIRA